jgi:hypothetical protein
MYGSTCNAGPEFPISLAEGTALGIEMTGGRRQQATPRQRPLAWTRRHILAASYVLAGHEEKRRSPTETEFPPSAARRLEHG